MKESIDLSGTKLSNKKKSSITSFCKLLQDLPNLGIKSITLYGSAVRDDYKPRKSDINLLVILESIDLSILKKVRNPVSRARRHRISPFFITEKDLRSSADVFPVKFLAMQEARKVLFGPDVLGEIDIAREHIRLRCEQEIKNVLLRLRRYYIMRGGRKLNQMMSSMIGGFLDTLRVVISLTEKNLPSRKDVVNLAAERFKFDAEILQNVSNLPNRNSSLSGKKVEELYDKFMTVVEKVAQITDQMD